MSRLVNLLKEHLFELAFWTKFSLDRDESGDYSRGQYLDNTNRPVDDILQSDYFLGRVGSMDSMYSLRLALTNIMKIQVDIHKVIEPNQLWVVSYDIGDEYHYFILIRLNDIVHTMNLYGGRKEVFYVSNKVSDFLQSWNILLSSMNANINEDILNSNFVTITGIHNNQQSHKLHRIKIHSVNLDNSTENSILNCISVYMGTTIPFYFKDRKEIEYVMKLVKKLESF